MGIINAVHRGLYAYPPDENEPVPDLADGMPEIADDGKTVTVKLKQGVTFTPPVSREVTSADVKYAIERAFTAAVTNGYAGIYFGDLVGAPEPGGDYKEIPGHRDAGRPDDRLQPAQGDGRGARGRAGDADLGPGAEGVRAALRP